MNRRTFFRALLAAPVAAVLPTPQYATGGYVQGLSLGRMGARVKDMTVSSIELKIDNSPIDKIIAEFKAAEKIRIDSIKSHNGANMKRHQVYLAGPIAGLSYDGAEDWRARVRRELEIAGVTGLSPLRAKEFLRSVSGALTATCEGYGDLSCMSSPRGITTRDRFDATRCDVLLVNLLGAKAVSIGTVMEIAWADAHRIPIVVAMEPEGNCHEHAMIAEAIGFRVATLDEAIHVAKAILAV